MGMVCSLKRVGADAIGEISRSPDAALALMDDHADEEFPLEEVRPPGCLGLLLRLTPIKVTQVAQRPNAELAPPVVDSDRYEIEVWDVINYLLTGTATDGDWPAGFLVNGGQELELEDDETHLRLLTPGDVAVIDQHLQSLSLDDLRARIDIPRMVKTRVLSKPRGKGAPDKSLEYLEYVLKDFEGLRNFIAGTRKQSAGLLVMLD